VWPRVDQISAAIVRHIFRWVRSTTRGRGPRRYRSVHVTFVVPHRPPATGTTISRHIRKCVIWAGVGNARHRTSPGRASSSLRVRSPVRGSMPSQQHFSAAHLNHPACPFRVGARFESRQGWESQLSGRGDENDSKRGASKSARSTASGEAATICDASTDSSRLTVVNSVTPRGSLARSAAE